MSGHGSTRSSGKRWKETASILQRALSPMAILIVGLLAQACSQGPRPRLTESDPSNPAVHVPRSAYTPVTGSYSSNRPVEPRPWLEQNKSVTPESEP
jgi:hypothetical protein